MKKLIAMFALMALVVVPVFAADVTSGDDSVTIKMTVEKYVAVFVTSSTDEVTASGGNDIIEDIPFNIAWDVNCDAMITLDPPVFNVDNGLGTGAIESNLQGTYDIPTIPEITHSTDGPSGDVDRTIDIAFTTATPAGAYLCTIQANIQTP